MYIILYICTYIILYYLYDQVRVYYCKEINGDLLRITRIIGLIIVIILYIIIGLLLV